MRVSTQENTPVPPARTARDMYRDHMTECLVATGTQPERATREAEKTYPRDRVRTARAERGAR